MAATSPPTNGTPSKRPWYRLHLSTWIVILLLVGLFVVVEIPGEVEPYMLWGNRFSHGWPWEFFSRYDNAEPVSKEKAPWTVPCAWKIYRNANWRDFSYRHLIANILTVALIIGTVAGLFEWRRFRSRVFQFTLRELLLLTLLTAVAFSYWRVHHNRRVHEREIAEAFSGFLADGYSCDRFMEEYRGPKILAKLFGTGAFPDFYAHVGYLCQVDNQNFQVRIPLERVFRT